MGSVAGSVTAHPNVAESEADPLIRFADLSPARRGTAQINGPTCASLSPDLLLTCSPDLLLSAEGRQP
jgi:hypothetical protein